MTYTDYKTALEKRAGVLDSLLAGTGDLMRGASDLGAVGATYLVAASVIGGAAAGWGAAKLTSHGRQDEDVARKSYENERLKADLGYLSARLRQEYAAKQGGTAPKAARVIG